MKKILTTILLSSLISAASAGTVILLWNASPDSQVTKYNVYALQGSNSVYTAGNSNANYIVTVPSSQLTATLTNVPSGMWTFTANAQDGLGNVSANCTNVTAYVSLAAPTVLRVNSITP